jgi:4-hydroxyphenylacetate 3-monooxygenase
MGEREETVGARTGEQYLAHLARSRRRLYLGNDRVDDATTHPQTRGAARSVAHVFDLQHHHAADCLFPDPETGEMINVSHIVPQSRDDLVRRHAGLVRIAEASVGIMGRTPDYKNVTFAGFAARWQEWAGPDGRNAEGAQRLVDYQKHLRRNDVALTHTIVHPTVDKARESVIAGTHVPLHKVGETAEGIVLRGARILATSAPFADELAVYPGFPLPGDGVEPYALSFAIPMDSPGLIFLCRDSYATPDVDPFDRPLSSRMDEQDAFVIFDDVVVPWERVFIDGDVGVYNSVMRTAWWPNIMQQTTIRALTKLEFAYGLGSRMARHLGDRSDATLDQLGEILCYLELTRAGLLLSIEHARDYGGGAVFPDDRPLLPLRATLTQWIPRVCEILMQIGSHNLLATPSRSMLDDPDLRPLIDTYLATADDEGAEARSATFRLAWDFIGSALGGRNDLYERFYLGSTGRNRRLLEMGVSGGGRRPSALQRRADALVDAMLPVPPPA